MKLKVVVDNKVGFGKYYMAEPALSFYIEDNNTKLLFDLGYSGVFLKNASLMGINLNEIDYVCFSHGHNDHTGGLLPWTYEFENTLVKFHPEIIAHNDAFKRKFIFNPDKIDSGIALNFDFIRTYFGITLTKTPRVITENLIFLGQIERVTEFENKEPIGKTYNDAGEVVDDFCLDDTALIYNSQKGIVIITGCSHSGICNIVKYAIRIASSYWKKDHICAIIGGIHLLNPRKELLNQTIAFLKDMDIWSFYLGHCVDFKSKASFLQAGLDVEEIEVGKVFEW